MKAVAVPDLGQAAPDLRDKARGVGGRKPKAVAPAPDEGNGAVDQGQPDRGGPAPPGPDLDAPPPLPGHCPVKPLGRLGTSSWYLDELGQLVRMGTKDWNDVGIITMFGRRYDWLEREYPRYGKPVKDPVTEEAVFPVVGFVYADVKRALITAASEEGIFDPQGRVRGPGAHRGADGELILHCGDKVLIGAATRGTPGPSGDVPAVGWCNPGLHDRYVYPTAPALPRPDVVRQDNDCAVQTLSKLRTWNWKRPGIDPVLVLGQIGALLVAGALEWRPHMWITGSRGIGKSTLIGKHGLIPCLLGDALIVTADATEAGLRQMTSQKTLPIMFEELEPDAKSDKAKAIIRLARLASSGGDIYRGSADHTAASFKAETCFVFASILVPAMLSQDRSRLAILELDRLDADAKKWTLNRHEWTAVGRALQRRMVDGWARFDETLDRYRAALGRAGHVDRGQDQYGTILACYDLLMFDALDDVGDETADDLGGDRFDDMARRLNFTTLSDALDTRDDEDECATHLATSLMHARGGDDRETVGQTIIRALNPRDLDAADRAQRRLEAMGLRVGKVTMGKSGEPGFGKIGPNDAPFVAIAGGRNVGLATIYRDTDWRDGVWMQSFRRLKCNVPRVKVRIAGSLDWCVAVPVERLVELGGEDAFADDEGDGE